MHSHWLIQGVAPGTPPRKSPKFFHFDVHILLNITASRVIAPMRLVPPGEILGLPEKIFVFCYLQTFLWHISMWFWSEWEKCILPICANISLRSSLSMIPSLFWSIKVKHYKHMRMRKSSNRKWVQDQWRVQKRVVAPIGGLVPIRPLFGKFVCQNDFWWMAHDGSTPLIRHWER